MPPRFFATIDGDSCRPQWMQPGAYLLPATSFRRKGFRTPRLPEGSEVAADWGGFVAAKNGGHVGFTVDTYRHWLRKIPGLRWASLWDMPCEPSLTDGGRLVRQRQVWTRDRAEALLEEQFGDHETFAWVPTLQGYTLDDYLHAVEDMYPLIEYLEEEYEFLQSKAFHDAEDDAIEGPNPWAHLFSSFRVGIGSLCARKNTAEIHQIVERLVRELPGTNFHLWGVKLQSLRDWPDGLPQQIVSTDSAAWNGRFGSDIPTLNAEMTRLSMSQREYGYKVRLPYYLERFAQATAHERDWDAVEEREWLAEQATARAATVTAAAAA